MTDVEACSCRCHLGGAFVSCDVDAGTSGVEGVAYCGPHVGAEATEPADASPEPRLTARDHWDAVDRLTRPQSRRLVRDNGHVERFRLPSLMTQLYEAMDGGEQGGAHGVPSSRPPMDAGCLSLLIEIATTIRHACHERRIKPTFDNELDLRALCSAVNTDGDLERIDKAAHLARSWAARIRATISNDPDRTWRMHGAACRVCGSVTVPVFDVDGTETRQPALMVHSADGLIVSVECGFCGSKLTGEELVDVVRRAPRAVSETA